MSKTVFFGLVSHRFPPSLASATTGVDNSLQNIIWREIQPGQVEILRNIGIDVCFNYNFIIHK